LKLIFASIVVFLLVILFLFALFPSDITVSRVIQINRPPEQIHKKIADLREWYGWNELILNRSDKKNQTPDSTDSNHIRNGSFTVELMKSVPDTVVVNWRHEKKSFTGNFITTGDHGQTIVQWTLHFHVGWYPWEKLASMFYDKQLGPLMEKSLLNLRNEVETNNH
jgi:hypothetical protein